MIDPYKYIAENYDLIVGKRYELDFLKSKIESLCPDAKSILEIACGTGGILKNFENDYEVSGIDLSQAMLKVAKKNLKSKPLLLNQNMLNLDIDKKFDVILCIFNSINHLHKFSEWQKVFKNVYEHLNEGGLFIFDIVTKHGLKAFLDEPPVIEKKDNKAIVLQFKEAPRGMLDLRIKVLNEKDTGESKAVEVDETYVREQSFETNKIKGELQKKFNFVKFYDLELGKVGKSSEVLFCTAIK